MGGVLSRRPGAPSPTLGPAGKLAVGDPSSSSDADSKFVLVAAPTETRPKANDETAPAPANFAEPTYDSTMGTTSKSSADIAKGGVSMDLDDSGDAFLVTETRKQDDAMDADVIRDKKSSKKTKLTLIQRIARLPPDLSQIVFDALVSTKSLPLGGVTLAEQFRYLWFLDLAVIGDSVDEDVVQTLLAQNAASLLALTLARCAKLTAEGANRLSFFSFPNLTALDLSECPGVTDDALQVLPRAPNLQSLKLEGTPITGHGLRHAEGLKHLTFLSLERCAHLKSVARDVFQDDPASQTTSSEERGSDEDEDSETRRAKKQKRERKNSRNKNAPPAGGVPCLASLTSLETLNLGWCNLVSDIDVVSLKSLVGLKTLVLARTKAGPRAASALRFLKKLQTLDLTGTKFDDFAMGVLTETRVVQNEVEGMKTGGDDGGSTDFCEKKEEAQVLPNLRTLSLEATAVTGRCAAAIANPNFAGSLTGLNLAFTEMNDDGVKALCGLQSLNALNLDSCPIGDVAARWLGKLPNLRSVTLADTDVGNDGLENLVRGVCGKELFHLDLGHTLVDDEGAGYLKQCTSLRYLSLDSRLVTDRGVLAAIPELEFLETLDLFAANVSDNGILAFRNLRHLKSLEMCGGNVTDVGAGRIVSFCANLETLNLGQNGGLTDVGAAHVATLRKLTMLNLTGSRITDTGVRNLCCLTNLRTLAVKDCRGVTNESVAFLKTQCAHLREVSFADRTRKTLSLNANSLSQETMDNDPNDDDDELNGTDGAPAPGTQHHLQQQVLHELTTEVEIYQEELSDDDLEHYQDVN